VIAVTKIAAPPVDWLSIAPEIALAAAGIVIVLGRSLIRRDPRVYDASLLTAVTGVIAAGVFLTMQWQQVRTDGPYQAIAGMVAVDGFGVFLSVVVVVALLLVLMLSSSYVPREGLDGAEYLALLLFSATGMLAMATANDLIVVFLALEVLSIPLYVLAAFDRRRLASQEAGLKYFVLGAFSSAVFLYGVALVYGATGTTSLTGIASFLSANTVLDNGVLLAGMALLLVGLGFKVAAAPFHMWTPDVYEGAPTPITAFMASATKAAGFAALLRVLATAFATYKLDWRPAIFALAVLSLVVGTVAALVQTDVKRILAYSSISHAGYVLIGLQAGTRRGVAASLFYLLVYTFMAVGAFAVVTVVACRGDERHSLDDYRGLAARRPLLAGAFTFFLLAQAGVPLTGGFVAKLTVFAAGVAARSYALVIVGVLAAVVGAYVYLRVVVAMFTTGEETPEPAGRVGVDAGTAAVLAVTVALTLVIGFLPGSFLHFARDATLLF
jgi:NADH-quinone oxidoreductase subunit N